MKTFFWIWCCKNTQTKLLCWWYAEVFKRNWWNSSLNPKDKKYLQSWRIYFDKVCKQQDWSDEINSRGTLQKKHQHQRARKLRSTKGKSIRSSIEHQNRYIWIQDIEDKPATEIGMLSELTSVYNPLGLASPFILKGRRITQKLCQGIAWDCCYTLC